MAVMSIDLLLLLFMAGYIGQEFLDPFPEHLEPLLVPDTLPLPLLPSLYPRLP